MKIICTFFFYLAFIGVVHAQAIVKAEDKFRIAVLACHRQFEPASALAKYLEIEADLCLWIGDNVYADAPKDPSFIQTCYNALGAKPAFKELINNYDYMVTWDDHDFGLNDAGKEYPFKKESKAMFRKFWNLEKVIPTEQEGIYYSRNFDIDGKTVQVIMLDVRYNRDIPDGNGDVLGSTQWNWFEEQLASTADLRLIVSGFQILLDKDAGSETWDKFPVAKKRLFDTIKKSKAENVLFLTGDQHYGEVSRLDNALDFDAIELQFAGINQIEEGEFNPLRVTQTIDSKHSLAFIDLQMEANDVDVPHVLFQIYDASTNERELNYRVNVSELKLEIEFTEQVYFTGTHEIELTHNYPGLHVRYTTDGSIPNSKSPIYKGPLKISANTIIKACLFQEDITQRSRVFSRYYEKLELKGAIKQSTANLEKGLAFGYYEGEFNQLPNFKTLSPLLQGTTLDFGPSSLARRDDHYAIRYEGFIQLPESGVYEFFTISDDGSNLFIADRLVVDNDGSHSKRKKAGIISLEKGLHKFKLDYFEDTDGVSLRIGYVAPSGNMRMLTPQSLFNTKKKVGDEQK